MECDFLIVGAGSAGATLAARLSANASTRVTLLESGPDYRSDEAPAAMRSANPSGIITEPEYAHFRFAELRRSARACSRSARSGAGAASAAARR